MSNASEVLKTIKDNDIKYVDLRFTDPRGKMQHVTMDVTVDRRGRVRRRHHVRRLVDRRLEGDPSVRHDADDGSGGGGDRSVLRAADARDLLRHPRSRHRRALQPRPAHHRQEGARLSAVDRRRRHRLFRPGGRVLHLRRRALLRRSLPAPASRSIPSEFPTNTRHRIRGRQSRPPAAHQGRLLSRSRRSIPRRTSAPTC